MCVRAAVSYQQKGAQGPRVTLNQSERKIWEAKLLKARSRRSDATLHEQALCDVQDAEEAE